MVLIKELGLVAFLIAQGANAFYAKNSDVISLDEKNFKKEILSSEHAAVVEFYAPWCGHCQNLKPDYEKVAKSLKGLAKVAAINCDEDKNKALCGQHGIKGFPTLKIFKPSSKKGKPTIEEYQGPRTAKAISDALAERIPNHITRVTAAKLDEFFATKNETAKAILFTNKGVTSPLWKALAIDFLGSMTFAQIRDKETAAVEAFGIEKYPTVVVLPGGDQEGIVYDGKVQRDDLFNFLKTIAPPAEPEATPEPKKTPKKEQKKPKKVDEQQPLTEEDKTETGDTPEIVVDGGKEKIEVPGLVDGTALTESCLDPKSKTCIIAITPTEDISEVLQNVHDTLLSRVVIPFNFYKLDSSSEHGADFAGKLELDGSSTKLIAINVRKNWVRKFEGDVDSQAAVLSWLDDVRLGDAKKEKLPVGLVEEEKDEL